ncbi:unnamed protein product [Colias eurytheme]|nr:unnamed protein product [Colias eurytheme]
MEKSASEPRVLHRLSAAALRGEAGRGISGDRGGGSGCISERVRERRGGFIKGAVIGSLGCGDKRLGDRRPGEGSGVVGGSVNGGRLAQGEPREPRRSFNPIGGGDGGGSSSAAATTTTGSALANGALSSVTSDVIDFLK